MPFTKHLMATFNLGNSFFSPFPQVPIPSPKSRTRKLKSQQTADEILRSDLTGLQILSSTVLPRLQEQPPSKGPAVITLHLYEQ